jgi:hypothetical protein
MVAAGAAVRLPGLRDDQGDRPRGAGGAGTAGSPRPREMARNGCESAYAQCDNSFFVGR